MKESLQEVKIEKERRAVIKREKLIEEAETEMERKARSEVERKTEIVSVITEVVATGIIAENVTEDRDRERHH